MGWKPADELASGGAKEYDVERCKRAAEALGEALKLTEETKRYELASMENYNDLFVVYNSGGKLNGLKEAIFRENPVQYDSRWAYNMNTDFRSRNFIPNGIKCYPTANYVNYFGMANGYPIKDMTKADAESGYDPKYPWKNRDPRFYKDIIFDGEWCGEAGNGAYCQLYTNGADSEEKRPAERLLHRLYE